jgi:hypothetical protein
MTGLKRPFHEDRCRGCARVLTTRKTVDRGYCRDCWAKEIGGDNESAF